MINLPEPKQYGDTSVEETLAKRLSVRDYGKGKLEFETISQMLWAAQGITSPHGFRTAPSAGGTYPLEIYLVAAEIEGLEPGIYRYSPHHHSLTLVREGDYRQQLTGAALDQEWVNEAQANLVITAVYERTTQRYGDRGIRYVHMEAGHVGQNLYLQSETLNIGMVVIGAFHDNQIAKILELPDNEAPLYVIPVGHKN